jgi:trigger factor
LNEIVRVNQLQAKPEQVRALVAEAAQSYEQPDAVIRWHYEARAAERFRAVCSRT